jgi:hypothetical protein
VPELTDEQIAELAREQYANEGTVEIDDAPDVSRSDDEHGAYVAAWVWVQWEGADDA